MTTSDDEPTFDEPETTHAEPEWAEDAEDAEDADDAPLAAPSSPGRWALAIVAALVVAAIGVTAWAMIFRATFDPLQPDKGREFVGISVVVALVAGWAVRTISGRANLTARLVTVVITALTCVVGRVAADAASLSKDNPTTTFGTLFGEFLGAPLDHVKNLQGLTYGIFAAALVIAWMSAGPQKQKPAKTTATAPTDEPRPGDEAVPDPLAATADTTETADDEER